MKALENCLSLIQEGRLKEALELLAAIVRDEDTGLRNSVVQIMARFRRLERERILGTRPEGDYTIELNQITYHSIDLIAAIRSEGGFWETEPAAEYVAAKTRILFVAANPDDGARLHLEAEVREIEEVLRASTHRERFEIHKIAATRPNDLLAAMIRIKPHFFHFSGHGMQAAICLLDDDHRAQKVSKVQLSEMFRLFRDVIGCVFLNACYSIEQAEAIQQYIPSVIGTNAKIADATAIQYATLFYQAIGEGEAVEYAFEYAKMSVGLNGLDGDDRLVMIGSGKQ